jgi:hypothetical protein
LSNLLSSLRRIWSGSTLVRVGLVLSVVAVLSLSVIVAATVFAEQSTGKASAINIAGSLRMQSYALSTRVADPRGETEARRVAAEEAIVEFERRLKSPGLMSGVPADSEQPVHRSYQRIVADWESTIKPLARRAIESETDRAEFLSTVPRFVDDVHVLVQQIETDLESRIQWLRLVLGLGFFVMMMLVVAALFLLNIEVFQPIARLVEAAKRVRTGTSTCGPRAQAGRDRPARQAFNFMVDDLARLRLAREAGRRQDPRPGAAQRIAGTPVRDDEDAGRKAARHRIAVARARDRAQGARRRKRSHLLDPRRRAACHCPRRRDGEGCADRDCQLAPARVASPGAPSPASGERRVIGIPLVGAASAAG